MNRKGVVFTMDILIGITLVLLLLFLVPIKFESVLPEISYEKLSYNADDAANVISILTGSDIKNTPTLKKLLDEGIIKQGDLNKSVIDLIGSFWYNGNLTIAQNITKETLGGLIKDFCFNLTTSDFHTIYSSCDTSSNIVAVSERIVSGYQIGKLPTGYISRASATQVIKNSSSFAYFGGFIGQGNITKNVTITNLDKVLEVFMEMNSGGAFNLSINGNYSGNYIPSYKQMRADQWVVCNQTYSTSICNTFKNGENQIKLVFTTNDSYIGGGFLRVIYNSTSLATSQNDSIYYFPGIEGIINIFDSFYVPGTLNGMNAYIHYKSPYNSFLTIANSTIWDQSSGGADNSVWINDAQIIGNLTRDGLSYANFSKSTVPVRLGLKNISFILATLPANIVLSTDVSGSMLGSKIAEAKNADKDLVTIVLGNPANLAGLNNYSDTTKATEPLTNNGAHLNRSINSYVAGGSTCICCGINSAIFTALDNRTGWYKAKGGNLVGTYSNSGGKFSDTAYKDNTYWYFGSTNNNYHVFANASVNFTITDSGIISNATALGLVTNYCHDGSNSAPPVCNGNSAEGAVQGPQDVFAYNYSSKKWTDIGDLRTDDNGYTVTSNFTFPGNATNFISPSGNVSVRLELDYNNGNNQDSWLALDYLALNVTFPHNETSRQDYIVIMSDGQANVVCGEQGTGNPDNDAINASCLAHKTYGMTVYSVGFGSDADNQTLQSIANCGGGQYYFANLGQLEQIFQNIAGTILNASYVAQILDTSQTVNTVLYPDSYIYLNFTPATTLKPGDLTINLESQRFGGNVTSPKNGTFTVPSNTRIVDAKVTSYSSAYWTDRAKSNGITVYNLSVYKANYTQMGDPYIVQIPAGTVNVGNNTVTIDTGVAPGNTTGGSPDAKVLYTVAIDASVDYGNVFDNQTDAINDSVSRLSQKLSQFASLINFQTDLVPTQFGQVPSLWGPTIFKIAVWSR